MRRVSVTVSRLRYPQWKYGDLLITGRVLALVIWCVMFMMLQESWGQCNLGSGQVSCDDDFCAGSCVRTGGECFCDGFGFCGTDQQRECSDEGCSDLGGECTGAACNCVIPPTGIELVSFTAEVGTDGSVTLRWETASEIDNAGFNLYRTPVDGTPDTIMSINDTLIPAQGGVSSGVSYSLIDSPGPGTFFYVLEDISIQGESVKHTPITVSIP